MNRGVQYNLPEAWVSWAHWEIEYKKRAHFTLMECVKKMDFKLPHDLRKVLFDALTAVVRKEMEKCHYSQVYLESDLT